MDRGSAESERRGGCVPRARGDGPAGRQSTIRGERCSPRTRGWTAPKCHSPSNVVVFPAHAGMDRPPAGGCRRSTVCSPRTRGWTITPPVLEARQLVFPAHAGMDRPLKTVYRGAFGVPRARGDGPLAPLLARYCLTCSPRTRGWTGLPDTIKALDVVFPAHAGMDRPEARRTRRRGRVPRARGDGPVFSGHYNGDPLVFPAHAGMDRANSA